MSSPIDTICGELSKLDAAVHRASLQPVRVQEGLKRVSRIREQLLRLEADLRQACSHVGVQGTCPGCQLEIPYTTSV